jgi:acyl-coenzyme A thioesterase PaaI-like protein
MGPAIFSISEGRGFTTVSLNVSYLRAARPGEPLLCEAVVVKHGRSQAYVEATLTRESGGEIVARATAVNLFLDPAKKG